MRGGGRLSGCAWRGLGRGADVPDAAGGGAAQARRPRRAEDAGLRCGHIAVRAEAHEATLDATCWLAGVSCRRGAAAASRACRAPRCAGRGAIIYAVGADQPGRALACVYNHEADGTACCTRKARRGGAAAAPRCLRWHGCAVLPPSSRLHRAACCAAAALRAVKPAAPLEASEARQRGGGGGG